MWVSVCTFNALHHLWAACYPFWILSQCLEKLKKQVAHQGDMMMAYEQIGMIIYEQKGLMCEYIWEKNMTVAYSEKCILYASDLAIVGLIAIAIVFLLWLSVTILRA